MKVNELLRQADRIEGFYNALKNQEEELSDTIASFKKDIDRDTKVSAVLKHLLDIMVKGEIKRTAGLITYGLKTIFDDQDLTFKPEINQKGGKIHIMLKTINDLPPDAIGVILSFLHTYQFSYLNSTFKTQNIYVISEVANEVFKDLKNFGLSKTFKGFLQNYEITQIPAKKHKKR